MEDNISFIDNNQLEEKVQFVLRQTDYTEEIAKDKLKEFNYDHIAVVKSFFGITEKKEPVVSSVNQEIYRQIRYKLDASMREYNKRKEIEESMK
jgi:hypothetical protein